MTNIRKHGKSTTSYLHCTRMGGMRGRASYTPGHFEECINSRETTNVQESGFLRHGKWKECCTTWSSPKFGLPGNSIDRFRLGRSWQSEYGISTRLIQPAISKLGSITSCGWQQRSIIAPIRLWFSGFLSNSLVLVDMRSLVPCPRSVNFATDRYPLHMRYREAA